MSSAAFAWRLLRMSIKTSCLKVFSSLPHPCWFSTYLFFWLLKEGGIKYTLDIPTFSVFQILLLSTAHACSGLVSVSPGASLSLSIWSWRLSSRKLCHSCFCAHGGNSPYPQPLLTLRSHPEALCFLDSSFSPPLCGVPRLWGPWTATSYLVLGKHWPVSRRRKSPLPV